MRSFCVFLTLTLLAACTGHQPTGSSQTRVVQTKSVRHWLLTREGGTGFVVEEFRAEPGSLQDLVDTHEFSNVDEAQRFAENRERELLTQEGAVNADVQTLAIESAAAVTEVPEERLWEVTQRWDLDWETRFAQWVDRDIDREFFERHGLSTDCADVAYALRWIFARTNGLPAANHLSASGVLFSQDSMRREWRRLPTGPTWDKDPRFLAALAYVMRMTYTGTLGKDTYPLEINRDAILVGTILLHLSGTGHTEIVTAVRDNHPTPILLWSSTVPASVRMLFARGFWMIDGPARNAGLVRMIWPRWDGTRWFLLEKSEMPHYSLEQYSLTKSGENFDDAVLSKLFPSFSKEQRLQGAIVDLRAAFSNREWVVNDGYIYCQSHNCQPGSMGHEDWSTPYRDKRIVELLSRVEPLMVSQDARSRWNRMQSEPFLSIGRLHFTFGTLVESFRARRFSSDPRVNPLRRWGLSSALAISSEVPAVPTREGVPASSVAPRVEVITPAQPTIVEPESSSETPSSDSPTETPSEEAPRDNGIRYWNQ